MIDYCILNSGSNGNCLVIHDYMAIDMGVTFKQIKPYLRKLQIILLTHIHSDHFNKSCIKKIIYEKPTIKFVCRDWLVEELIKLGVAKKNIYVLKNKKTYNLGAFNVMPIDTYHDVDNTSYRIDFKPYTMYYATDTKELPQLDCLKGLNGYFIEANYNEELLEKHIQECIENKDEENKLFYLNRVKNTHLSDRQTTDFLIKNMTGESQYIKLHQSSYNYKTID